MMLRRVGRKFGAELGMIAITVSLGAGALLGSGIATSDLATVDPLTWLANRDGGITRVNPQTGRPVDGLKISQSAGLEVVQGDGILTVTDPVTGEVTVIDLSLLSVAGKRSAGGNVEVLVATGKIFLVNRDVGELSRLNPLNAATLGRPVRLDRRLADSTVAADGAVWLLDQEGQLQSQTWSDPQAGFVPGQSQVIKGVGDKAVLVAHGTGVTVVDPASRTATRVGTEGPDRTTTLPALDGPLVAADLSPPDLTVVASPDRSALLVLKDNDPSIVDTARRGCHRPGKPVVFRDRVYAACPGDRKVIVVDPDGGPGQDIVTPAGEQIELVFHAGMLLVNVRDGQNGLIVMADGAVREIRTHDPDLRVTLPAAIPSSLPSTMDGRSTGPRSPAPRNTPASPAPAGASPRVTGSPTAARTPARTTAPPPSSPAPNPQQQTPAILSATARSDGSVLVTWRQPAIAPATYRVLRADDPRQVLATVGGTADQAIIPPGLPPGRPISLLVEAVSASGQGFRSAPVSVTPYNVPAAPAIQPLTITARTPGTISLRVTIDPPADDGGSGLTTYDVTLRDAGGRTLAAAQGIPAGQRQYDFDIPCRGSGDLCLSGGRVEVIASVYNAAGAGPAGTRSSDIPYPAQYDRNGDPGATIMIVSSGGKCMDRSGRNMVLRTCNGSQGQLWQASNRGYIRSLLDNACMFTDDPGKLTTQTGQDCTKSERRYDDLSVNRNERSLRNSEHGSCIAVMGDPAGEGTAVAANRGCLNTAAERWTFFKPVQPLQTVAQYRSDVPVMLLLLLVLGLARIRHHRAPSDRDGAR